MATSAAGNLSSVYQPSVAPTNKKADLTSSDFINLMITQLKNQDPTKPVTNSELLGQVTQIGTLQSQQSLTSNIQEMVLQNQVSAASGMIGKKVAGLDASGGVIDGVVTSVKVSNKKVTLSLDNGKELSLDKVTDVASAPVATAGVKASATTVTGLAN